MRRVSGLLSAACAISPVSLPDLCMPLPRSCYGVHILCGERTVAMGRVVGDGVLNLEIVDVAVDPAHPGKGLGRKVMEHIVAWLDANVADGPMSR